MEFLIQIAKLFLLPIFSYLLGSIPFGLILTRTFTNIDITKHGSGNIGATNVRRVAGNKLGILTLAGDVLKGALPVYFAIIIMKIDIQSIGKIESIPVWGDFYLSLVAFSAFLGHLYPIFTKLKKGGKGVATAGGAFLAISPMTLLISLIVFLLIIWRFKRVSLASLMAVGVLPITIWVITDSIVLTGYALITALFIFLRHKENIRRLLAGTEPTIKS